MFLSFWRENRRFFLCFAVLLLVVPFFAAAAFAEPEWTNIEVVVYSKDAPPLPESGILRVYALGVQIANSTDPAFKSAIVVQETNNGTAQIRLSKGEYNVTFWKRPQHKHDGELDRLVASKELNIEDTRRPYSLEFRTEKTRDYILKLWLFDLTYPDVPLDASVLRVEFRGVRKELSFVVKDEKPYMNGGHWQGFKEYGTRERRLTHSGFFIAGDLNREEYLMQIWDGSRLLGRFWIFMDEDKELRVNVPYEKQERSNAVYWAWKEQQDWLLQHQPPAGGGTDGSYNTIAEGVGNQTLQADKEWKSYLKSIGVLDPADPKLTVNVVDANITLGVPQANVTCYYPVGLKAASQLTNDTGWVSFDLMSANYTVTATAPNYITNQTTVVLLSDTVLTLQIFDPTLDFSIEIFTASKTSYNVGETVQLWARIVNTGSMTMEASLAPLRAYFTIYSPTGRTINAGSDYGPWGTIATGGIDLLEGTWTMPSNPEPGLYDIYVTITASQYGLTATHNMRKNSAFSIYAPLAPDFSVSAAPPSQTAQQGQSVSYAITVTSINGWASSVTLSTSLTPGASTVSFSTNPVNPTGTSTLTITTSASTPTGTYDFVVTGTSGVTQHTRSVSITVQKATTTPTLGFSIDLFTSSKTSYNPGETVQIWARIVNTGTITIESYHATGHFTIYSPIGGSIDAGVGGNTGNLGPGQISVLTGTWTVPSNPAAGLYDIYVTITATQSGLTATHDMRKNSAFSVSAPPAPDFSISVSYPQTVEQDQSASYTVTVTSINGWTSPVTLKTSLTPGASIVSFSNNPVNPTGTSTLTLTTSTSTPAGTYDFTVIGTSSVTQHTCSGSITVQKPYLLTAVVDRGSNGNYSQTDTGVTIIISGSYKPGATVNLGVYYQKYDSNMNSGVWSDSGRTAVAICGGDGTYSATITLPNTAVYGRYKVVATSSTGARAECRFNVGVKIGPFFLLPLYSTTEVQEYCNKFSDFFGEALRDLFVGLTFIAGVSLLGKLAPYAFKLGEILKQVGQLVKRVTETIKKMTDVYQIYSAIASSPTYEKLVALVEATLIVAGLTDPTHILVNLVGCFLVTWLKSLPYELEALSSLPSSFVVFDLTKYASFLSWLGFPTAYSTWQNFANTFPIIPGIGLLPFVMMFSMGEFAHVELETNGFIDGIIPNIVALRITNVDRIMFDIPEAITNFANFIDQSLRNIWETVEQVASGVASTVGSAINGITATIKSSVSGTISLLAKAAGDYAIPSGHRLIGCVWDIATNLPTAGITWPVTIKTFYSAEDIAAAGIDESTLQIRYWDVNNWVPLAETGVDTVNKYVWANLYHFSSYAPMGEPPLSPSGGGTSGSVAGGGGGGGAVGGADPPAIRSIRINGSIDVVFKRITDAYTRPALYTGTETIRISGVWCLNFTVNSFDTNDPPRTPLVHTMEVRFPNGTIMTYTDFVRDPETRLELLHIPLVGWVEGDYQFQIIVENQAKERCILTFHVQLTNIILRPTGTFASGIDILSRIPPEVFVILTLSALGVAVLHQRSSIAEWWRRQSQESRK